MESEGDQETIMEGDQEKKQEQSLGEISQRLTKKAKHIKNRLKSIESSTGQSTLFEKMRNVADSVYQSANPQGHDTAAKQEFINKHNKLLEGSVTEEQPEEHDNIEKKNINTIIETSLKQKVQEIVNTPKQHEQINPPKDNGFEKVINEIEKNGPLDQEAKQALGTIRHWIKHDLFSHVTIEVLTALLTQVPAAPVLGRWVSMTIDIVLNTLGLTKTLSRKQCTILSEYLNYKSCYIKTKNADNVAAYTMSEASTEQNLIARYGEYASIDPKGNTKGRGVSLVSMFCPEARHALGNNHKQNSSHSGNASRLGNGCNNQEEHIHCLGDINIDPAVSQKGIDINKIVVTFQQVDLGRSCENPYAGKTGTTMIPGYGLTRMIQKEIKGSYENIHLTQALGDIFLIKHISDLGDVENQMKTYEKNGFIKEVKSTSGGDGKFILTEQGKNFLIKKGKINVDGTPNTDKIFILQL